jgi:Esterase/lipase
MPTARTEEFYNIAESDMGQLKARAADISGYNTIRNPDQYEIDWAPFYREGDRRTDELREAVRTELNVLYGDHEAKMLDIYYPDGKLENAPVFIFLHGGAFREGHPRHYGYVGRPYVDNGVIFICAGHRMSPELVYPDTALDIAELVGWVYHNIGSRGGDPRSIYLGGHSSGATVSALLSVRDDWQAGVRVPVDVLRGIVLSGATYDFREDFPGNLVSDVSRREEASAICNMQRVVPEAVFTFGVNEINRGDPTRFQRLARPLAEAMSKAGAKVTVIPLQSANHHGTCEAICDQSGPVFPAALGMMLANSEAGN